MLCSLVSLRLACLLLSTDARPSGKTAGKNIFKQAGGEREKGKKKKSKPGEEVVNEERMCETEKELR